MRRFNGRARQARRAPAAEAAAALAVAWRQQRSGNFVAAYDIAEDALRRAPDSLPLQHLSILALASCGSTAAALAAYRASRLPASRHEDHLALEARLLKDLAFRADNAGNSALLAQAAQAYERIAERTGGSFTAQNAALLWMLAGEGERAAGLSAAVLAELSRTTPAQDEQAAYFHWATLTEAALVLDDRAALPALVARANPLCRADLWARTRTHAQLRRLLPLRPECTDIVDGWYRPAVAFVLRGDAEPAAAAAAPLDTDVPALAYGAGPARADDWASLAALGTQLHVVLAAAPPEAAARSASGRTNAYTWSSLLLDDVDEQHRTCAETALGLSLGHAHALHAPWVVVRRSAAGWRQHREVDAQWLASVRGPAGIATAARASYGFLFADAVGYSTLSASETRRYWEKLLPDAVAAVLRRHAAELLFRKTWGDAIHGVFRSATAAAAAALEMTAATAQLADELSLGRRLAFRVAVHYGAADRGQDPVEELASFYGPQLSFAARIVPVAPPGSIFATEAFAAQLSLEGAAQVACEYVGTTSLAKDYGRVRLLALRVPS